MMNKKKIISILTIMIILMSVLSVTCANIVWASSEKKQDTSLSFEEKLLVNKPEILEGTTSKFEKKISQSEINSQLTLVKSVDSTAKLSDESPIVAKTEDMSYIVRYQLTGKNIEKNSFIFFILDSASNLTGSGEVFATSIKGTIKAYVYENNLLKMNIIGNIDTEDYRADILDESGNIQKVFKYNAEIQSKNLVSCLTSCVTEALGGWQTTIILAACVAACGVTVGLGCGICAATLAGYGVGFCWERCA